MEIELSSKPTQYLREHLNVGASVYSTSDKQFTWLVFLIHLSHIFMPHFIVDVNPRKRPLPTEKNVSSGPNLRAVLPSSGHPTVFPNPSQGPAEISLLPPKQPRGIQHPVESGFGRPSSPRTTYLLPNGRNSPSNSFSSNRSNAPPGRQPHAYFPTNDNVYQYRPPNPHSSSYTSSPFRSRDREMPGYSPNGPGYRTVSHSSHSYPSSDRDPHRNALPYPMTNAVHQRDVVSGYHNEVSFSQNMMNMSTVSRTLARKPISDFSIFSENNL